MSKQYIGGIRLGSKDPIEDVAAVLAWANGMSAVIGKHEPLKEYPDSLIAGRLETYGQAPTAVNIAKVRSYLEGDTPKP